jgi:UDP-N-acetylglucosamine:LPS N-acetylglucosamine transferase
MYNNMSLQKDVRTFNEPVLVVTTSAGGGAVSIGDALVEMMADKKVKRIKLEEYLPKRAAIEDFERYKKIVKHAPWLLNIIYRVPIFYLRKYLRERFFFKDDLKTLEKVINRYKPKTIVCISHRTLFWLSILKEKKRYNFKLWGFLSEYGDNIGYRYLFWNQVDGFISPVEKERLSYPFDKKVRFIHCEIPARKKFYKIKAGSKSSVLIVNGLWGQMDVEYIIRDLRSYKEDIRIDVICGENQDLYRKIRKMEDYNLRVYMVVGSLVQHLKKAASIITKPGLATLIEANASKRKIFLLRGLPVAEDNNARYAIENFEAQWFDIDSFARWHSKTS